jgi:hypothetical protein
MRVSHPDSWPSLTCILQYIVTTCLAILDAINHAAHLVGPSIWTAFKWAGNGLSVAASALLEIVLLLLLWMSIIYLCCFTIFMVCRVVRRHRKQSSRRMTERQPLLSPCLPRRTRLASWTRSNSSSERRRHHDHQVHRDLFRVEIGRRRQDLLRREQHRAVEIRCREYRERRLREIGQQPTSPPMYAQHRTIITWLHASSVSTTAIPHYPHYGTLPTRGVQTRSEPPPPYSQHVVVQPPPYS